MDADSEPVPPSRPSRTVSPRATWWVAAAALVLALSAGTMAAVAVMNSHRTGSATGQMPGMAMDGADASHMAPIPSAGVADATAAEGATLLPHTVVDDTWVFQLTARPVRWEIASGVKVTAWSYNGIVPGPTIRVPDGQKVRIEFRNDLPEATTVHWHGIDVPNAMDGVADLTQPAIPPGESFTYAFTARPAGRDSGSGGTFLYHSHTDEDRQVSAGLSGALIIDPPDAASAPRYDVERIIAVQEWTLAGNATIPAMQMSGMQPNWFTINGKSFPETETIKVRTGQRVLLRLIGAGQFEHPMHLHGTTFDVVAVDGHPLEQPIERDVQPVSSGERYDLAFVAPAAGKWLFHCHIGHHMTNNGKAPGGLQLVIDVT